MEKYIEEFTQCMFTFARNTDKMILTFCPCHTKANDYRGAKKKLRRRRTFSFVPSTYRRIPNAVCCVALHTVCGIRQFTFRFSFVDCNAQSSKWNKLEENRSNSVPCIIFTIINLFLKRATSTVKHTQGENSKSLNRRKHLRGVRQVR